MVGEVYAVAGVDGDAVLSDALQGQGRHEGCRLRGQAGKVLVVFRPAPAFIPAGAKEQKVRPTYFILMGPEQGQGNFPQPPAVQREAGAHEGLRRESVQGPATLYHVGRGVHVGAGVRIHVQNGLPVARLPDGAGGGENRLLRAGIHRHFRGNAVGQVENHRNASEIR